MYIKIKFIKRFLLISTCITFAGFNYLTYVKADNATVTETCDITIDTDCDGLTNNEEELYGTGPDTPDTDNDGYSDGVEIKSGYDPLKAAPYDRLSVSTNENDASTISNTDTATNSFSQDLSELLQAKGNEPITTTDIQDFVDQQLSEKSGPTLDFSNLPGVESSQLKIISQQYANLNAEDRKQKIKEDAAKYLVSLAYLLASNSPQPITSGDDFNSFKNDFEIHIQSIGSENPDYEYFSDLGRRLVVIQEQLLNLEVPETMAGLHIKLAQLINGYLTLRGNDVNANDAIGRMALYGKITQLTTLTDSFFSTDVVNYFSQLD